MSKKSHKRPKKETRENVLRIRLTDAERKILNDFADGKALDTSTWARSQLLSIVKNASKKT